MTSKINPYDVDYVMRSARNWRPGQDFVVLIGIEDKPSARYAFGHPDQARLFVERHIGENPAMTAWPEDRTPIDQTAHQSPDQSMSLTDRIIDYETGELAEDELVPFFQALIDSGLAWQLQGHYGRTAAALIEAGHCHPKGSATT